jgi:hypothetical protein
MTKIMKPRLSNSIPVLKRQLKDVAKTIEKLALDAGHDYTNIDPLDFSDYEDDIDIGGIEAEMMLAESLYGNLKEATRLAYIYQDIADKIEELKQNKAELQLTR